MDPRTRRLGWGWWALAYGLVALALFAGYRWVTDGPPGWVRSLLPSRVTMSDAQGRTVVKGSPTFRLSRATAATNRPPPVCKGDKHHIEKAGSHLQGFIETTKRWPEDMAEVEAWASKNRKAQAAAFRSPRDGQPYVLVLTDRSLGAAYLCLAEQTGKDGWRLVYDPGSPDRQIATDDMPHLFRPYPEPHDLRPYSEVKAAAPPGSSAP